MLYRLNFTLSAGRTGTEWLARLIAENFGVPAVHEPLEIDDFGVRMPDIKIMSTFNDRGNSDLVRSFYASKLAELTGRECYVETNHALGKCGLIENLLAQGLGSESCIVVLKRDMFRQCHSYLVRRDFTNVTIVWQWYLHYAYRNIIVDTDPFRFLGDMGQAVWYSHEMAARQIYYQTLFGDRIKMLACNLEDLNVTEMADAFLRQLGFNGTVRLPAAANLNALKDESGYTERLREGLAALDCDIASMVRSYLASGRRLDSP